ncbi:divalent-cation tolerance protein CutA [Mycoavidus sp. B2-EB]|uniref:divalent-cation tolerance protein CutA n=1 Tax=Mycoavidus sp. B2-EB TaxID=2651972 RepID=UPI00162A056B|nr:divalent-cation tolerance protein CutA [Mycoavidus sp. B2-EB]BBO59676.1 periplasmic cytochrome biogenesis protein [Mycoavidus sp. B2-EB]
MVDTVILVLTTLPSTEAAAGFSREALDTKLAACVTQFAPVHSRYFWQGKFEETEEIALLFKTTVEMAPKLKEWIARHHPYQTPEILSWPTSAHPAYAQWVAAQTTAL